MATIRVAYGLGFRTALLEGFGRSIGLAQR
jgi:hypothetical protein